MNKAMHVGGYVLAGVFIYFILGLGTVFPPHHLLIAVFGIGVLWGFYKLMDSWMRY